MGPESSDAIAHAVNEATRLGLEPGLVTASSWNNGGSWVRQEHGVMGILHSTTEIIDLSTKLRKDGTLECALPEGRWKINRYVCTNLGVPLKRPSPNSDGLMCDHFGAEATVAHLQHFIDRLGPRIDLGNSALKYLYNDSYEIRGPVWTPLLREEFIAWRGYDPVPFLPVLDGKTVINPEVSERFRFDFDMTLSDLAIENHYRKGVEFCGEYGLGYQAEGGGPGPPLHQVPVESIRSLGSLTVPRGEFWHNDAGRIDNEGFNSHWFVKGIASAAHLYDQTFVEAESFTSTIIWQDGCFDLKPTADQAFCEGLNRIVFHTSPHVPSEFGNDPAAGSKGRKDDPAARAII